MTNFNSESFIFRSDFEIFQDVVVIFENDIDLSISDDKIIKSYINYKFEVYRDNNIQDTTLRELIKEEFDDFIENHWKKIENKILDIVVEYCLIREFWINFNDDNRFKVFIMKEIVNKAINETYNEFEWSIEQIEAVEQSFLKIFTRTLRTKSQLMSIEFESQTSFSAKYLKIRLSTVTSTPLRYEPSEVTLIKQEYEESESSAINFFRQSKHQRDALQSEYQRDSSQSALVSQDARVQRFYQRDALQSEYQRDSPQSALVSQDARVQSFYQRD